MLRKIISFIVLSLFCCHLKGQIPFFETSYLKVGADVCFSIQQLASGSIYLAGYNENGISGQYDFSLLKADPAGNLIWSKNYGTVYNDQCLGMCIADSVNLMMVGITEDPANQFSANVLLVKVDSSGNELWRHVYGGPLNEQAKWIQQLPDKGYVFCGFAPGSLGSIDSYIVRTDSSGNELWESLIGRSATETADRVISIPGGNFIVATTTTTHGNSDVELSMLDQSGIIVWDTITGDSLQCGGQGLLFDSHNRIIVFGETEISPFSQFDYFIQAFDLTGHELWRRAFGGQGTNALFDLKEDSNGNFIGTGYSNSIAGGSSPLNVAVLKTDSIGNLLWAREYGGAGIDIGQSLLIATDKSLYIGGRISNADDDFYLLHLDQDGLLSGLQEKNPENKLFTIAPNPSSGSVKFYWHQKIKNWEITDCTGINILDSGTSVLESVSYPDLSFLKAGLYILKATNEGGSVESEKFILK